MSYRRQRNISSKASKPFQDNITTCLDGLKKTTEIVYELSPWWWTLHVKKILISSWGNFYRTWNNMAAVRNLYYHGDAQKWSGGKWQTFQTSSEQSSWWQAPLKFRFFYQMTSKIETFHPHLLLIEIKWRRYFLREIIDLGGFKKKSIFSRKTMQLSREMKYSSENWTRDWHGEGNEWLGPFRDS